MADEKRHRPRSLKRYSEEVQKAAREAMIEFSFLASMGERGENYSASIRDGSQDALRIVEMAAFLIDRAQGEPAGVICTGCGSSWTDERLAEEKAARPALRSCCPPDPLTPDRWESLRLEMQRRLRLATGEPTAVLSFEFPANAI